MELIREFESIRTGLDPDGFMHFHACRLCENYDLCEKCEENSDKLHDDSHVFVKIPCPLKSDVLDGKVLKGI